MARSLRGSISCCAIALSAYSTILTDNHLHRRTHASGIGHRCIELCPDIVGARDADVAGEAVHARGVGGGGGA